jgi:transcriptional regulator with XRE-family HTH domain
MATQKLAAPAPDLPTFDLAALGARLKEARLARHLPMRTVAHTAGISVTHISQIERGRNCPTIGALARIAAALGVSLHYFLEPEPRPEVQYSLRGERREIQFEDRRTRTLGTRVSDGICGGRVHVFLYRVEPHASMADADRVWIPAMQQNYILSGTLHIVADGKQHEFSAGDALVIQPAVDIRVFNPGPEPCEMIAVLRNEQARWIPGRGEAVARCLETSA